MVEILFIYSTKTLIPRLFGPRPDLCESCTSTRTVHLDRHMTGQKLIGKQFSSEHGGGGSYRRRSVLLCVHAGTVHAEFKKVSALFNAHH